MATQVYQSIELLAGLASGIVASGFDGEAQEDL
jgi:hypothetical protein